MPNLSVYNDPDCPADIVIVGLGPAGLTAALKAISLGKKVIAFTNRDTYIRNQRVILRDNSLQFLRSHCQTDADFAFINTITSEQNSVKIKAIEKFLYEKIINSPYITIIDSRAQPIESFGVDNNVNYCKVNNQNYYFKHLIAADGARHRCCDQLNRDLNTQITYSSVSGERHPFHAVIQLKLKNNHLSASPIKKIDIIEKMRHLETQGWNRPFQPLTFVLTNEAQSEFYIASEIPQRIFDASAEEKPQLLKKWAADVMFEKYGFNEEQIEYNYTNPADPNYALQAATFEMQHLERCDQPIIQLAQGVFAPIGDARHSPNYKFGHGLNDGITTAISFVDSLLPGAKGFNEANYRNIIDHLNKEIVAGIEVQQRVKLSITKLYTEKLNEHFDKLISRIREKRKNDVHLIPKLESAKQLFSLQDPDLSSVYETISTIQPILEKHRHNDIFNYLYRFIRSLFDNKANLTHSLILVDDIKHDLQQYTYQF